MESEEVAMDELSGFRETSKLAMGQIVDLFVYELGFIGILRNPNCWSRPHPLMLVLITKYC